MAEVINGILINEAETKNIMTKSSLPVGGYSVNPYVGCTHAVSYTHLIALNRRNYQFLEHDFDILSNKMPRNIIEHLDERNVKTMMESRGVGGFNVIFSDSDSDMVDAVTSHREFYPYNLDLVNKKMLFYNIQAKADDVKEFDIDILKLQSELRMLQQYVNDFASFVKGY